MAIWFMRISAVICLASIVGVLSLVGADWYAEVRDRAAMAAAQQHVQDLGGSFFAEPADEMVIMLNDAAIGDAQIELLVVDLRALNRRSSHLPQSFAFNLAGTQVGDKGVQAISTLPVAWLNLNGTQVTDQGFQHLRNQPRLNLVTVAGTKVTRPAMDEMRTALPQLLIFVSDQRRP
jgi:hypothetical protein